MNIYLYLRVKRTSDPVHDPRAISMIRVSLFNAIVFIAFWADTTHEREM